MEEPLILGVFEVEHDAAVFTLVAIVRHLEQVKHLLLNMERNFPHLIFCHDQVITVTDPFPQNLL